MKVLCASIAIGSCVAAVVGAVTGEFVIALGFGCCAYTWFYVGYVWGKGHGR